MKNILKVWLYQLTDGLKKNTIGIIVMLFVMFVIGYLVFTEGINSMIENLIITVVIVAMALLGVNNIVSILKKKTTHTSEDEGDKEDNTTENKNIE